jgi:hypothetical protein
MEMGVAASSSLSLPSWATIALDRPPEGVHVYSPRQRKPPHSARSAMSRPSQVTAHPYARLCRLLGGPQSRWTNPRRRSMFIAHDREASALRYECHVPAIPGHCSPITHECAACWVGPQSRWTDPRRGSMFIAHDRESLRTPLGVPCP